MVMTFTDEQISRLTAAVDQQIEAAALRAPPLKADKQSEPTAEAKLDLPLSPLSLAPTAAFDGCGRTEPLKPDRERATMRLLPWLLVVVLIATGGALFWENSRSETGSPRPETTKGTESSPASKDETKQALIDLQQIVKDLQRQLSTEQEQRKSLSDQVGALSGRVDGLEQARAEAPRSAKKRGR